MHGVCSNGFRLTAPRTVRHFDLYFPQDQRAIKKERSRGGESIEKDAGEAVDDVNPMWISPPPAGRKVRILHFIRRKDKQAKARKVKKEQLRRITTVE